MSTSGVCQICEAAEGKFTCNRCGAFVCEDHYDPEQQVCLDCAELAGDPDEPSGFKTD